MRRAPGHCPCAGENLEMLSQGTGRAVPACLLPGRSLWEGGESEQQRAFGRWRWAVLNPPSPR